MKILQLSEKGLFLISSEILFCQALVPSEVFLVDMIPFLFFQYIPHLLVIFLLPCLHAAKLFLLPPISLVSTDAGKSLRFLFLYACPVFQSLQCSPSKTTTLYDCKRFYFSSHLVQSWFHFHWWFSKAVPCVP